MGRMKQVTVYTDGASKGNPGLGGYGVVLLYGGHRMELSGGFRHTTNNRMELFAAIVALEALKSPCEVALYSDSRYLVDAITKGWLPGWKKNAWRKRPNKHLKNADLWRRLDAAAAPHSIQWNWVRGHVGDVENERCDRLADRATRVAGLPDDEGYLHERGSEGAQGELI